MTDNEIVKASECCGSPYNRCLECPLCEMERVKCVTELIANALDLINRQKAEIERLKAGLKEDSRVMKQALVLVDEIKKEIAVDIETAKVEAIKEFAEMLKKLHSRIDVLCPIEVISMPTVSLDYYVKKYVKEKVGEKNGIAEENS